MKKHLQLLLAFLLLFPFFPAKNQAETTTGSTIAGVISEDRVLTKEGSPYYQTGIIDIDTGVTLTIEPGVQLIGENGVWVSVKGKLHAVGTEQDPILLQDVYVQGSAFNNSAIQIEYADHYHQSKYNGGFLITTIKNNVILRHNQYRNGSISLSSSILDSIIEHNFFSQKATLNVTNGPGKIIIKDNTFINPQDYRTPDIKLTSREPDGGNANIFINENNFFGYPRLKVDISGYKGILFDGKNNYWGVTDNKRINQGIADVNDNINYRDKLDISTVSYKPFDNSYPLGNLEAPFVTNVSDREQSVSGMTDADSLVEIYHADVKIGEGYSLKDGSFRISIERQNGGTELTIKARDSYNRSSSSMTVTVLDVTPPEAPVVNEVTDNTVEITGTAEPFSTVKVVIADVSIGTDVSDEKGDFSIAIEKLKADTQVSVTATDAFDNISEATYVTVKDRTPPSVPQLLTNEITDHTTNISGVTDKGTIIKIVAKETVIGTDYTVDGTFSINFQPQVAGTVIEVFAEDLVNNRSESVQLTVKDTTAPWLLLSDVFHVSDASKEVYGNTEKGAKITITKGEDFLAEGYAKEDGSFAIPIARQKAGTVLSVTARDAANNVSPVVNTQVIDRTPPPVPSVNPVTNKAAEITGNTEIGATVNAVMGSKTYSATANNKGNYKIRIPVQNSGTVISVSSIDFTQNQSQSRKVTVTRIAPNIPVVNSVTNKSTTVTGVTEKAATVIVKAGTLSYSSIADSYGKFSVKIPTQNSNVELSIMAKDAAGNFSLSNKMLVTRVAPNVPVVTVINNKLAAVTGITEKYAVVTVLIGTKSYSAKADSVGNFKVTIPIQNSGNSIKVTSTVAGKVSNTRSLTVTRVAPNIPVVNPVRNYSTSVTGKTEKNAVVAVKIGTKVYTTKANIYGNFKVTIPKQKARTYLNVTAKDTKGFISATRTVKVY